LNPYIVGHYRLKVANDVFNSMEYVLSCHPAMSHSVHSIMSCYWAARHCSSALQMVNRGVAWYCSRTVAVCPHVLQALNMSPTRTSCRLMMAMTSIALETCVCGLETHKYSYLGMPSRFFFMLDARGPQGAVGHVTASEPSQQGGRVRCRRRCGGTGALPNREAGSRATVHMVAPEPSLVGRWGPEPLDTWHQQSSLWQRGRVWCSWAHDAAWMHITLFVVT
jgi:hypothetical protein